jgi:hypothetical protein
MTTHSNTSETHHQKMRLGVAVRHPPLTEPAVHAVLAGPGGAS